MELREYLAIARRWWWLLLLGAIIGGGAGYYFAQSKTPLYQSQTTLMIGRFIESANPNYNEAYTAQRLPRTTLVARRSRHVAALTRWASPPAVALRTALFVLTGRLGPGLVLRGFDGIADWTPPR